MIGAPAGQIRIKTIAHHGNGICFSLQHRKLGNHGLCLCQLIFSAVRHKYASCTDGTVKHLYKAFLRAYVQISQHLQPCFFYIPNIISCKRSTLL